MAQTLQVLSVNVGTAQPVRIGERKILTAIGKSCTPGPVAVGRLGLAGDEQADLTVHDAFWHAQRRERGISLFDEPLPPGFMGENLTVDGLLEHEVYVGDRLHFPDCVLRVAAPREPCYKFNAVMGFAQAGRAMAIAGCCGYYLAVEQTGTIAAGQQATLEPGQRGLSIAQAFAGKFAKHAR